MANLAGCVSRVNEGWGLGNADGLPEQAWRSPLYLLSFPFFWKLLLALSETLHSLVET
jgi:hypothetical protein